MTTRAPLGCIVLLGVPFFLALGVLFLALGIGDLLGSHRDAPTVSGEPWVMICASVYIIALAMAVLFQYLRGRRKSPGLREVFFEEGGIVRPKREQREAILRPRRELAVAILLGTGVLLPLAVLGWVAIFTRPGPNAFLLTPVVTAGAVSMMARAVFQLRDAISLKPLLTLSRSPSVPGDRLDGRFELARPFPDRRQEAVVFLRAGIERDVKKKRTVEVLLAEGYRVTLAGGTTATIEADVPEDGPVSDLDGYPATLWEIVVCVPLLAWFRVFPLCTSWTFLVPVVAAEDVAKDA